MTPKRFIEHMSKIERALVLKGYKVRDIVQLEEDALIIAGPKPGFCKYLSSLARLIRSKLIEKS
jgi:hypothetical protein